MSQLSKNQTEVLLRPIKPSRVSKLEGMSHVEAYDIRAMLTRVFGFGRWDEVAVEPTVMLYEQETTTRAGKDAYKVAYRASRRLVIRDQDGEHLCSHDGSAVGESIMPDFKRGDAHDMAIKTSESQALKRAAINLGDQFGLSLYAKGATGALVRAVVDFDVEYVEPEPVAPGDDGPAVVEAQSAVVLSAENLGKFNAVCRGVGLEPSSVVGKAFPKGVPEVLLDSHLPAMRAAFKALKAASDHLAVVGAVVNNTATVGDAALDLLGGLLDDASGAMPLGEDELLASAAQVKKIQVLMGEHGITNRTARLDFIKDALGLEVRPASTKNLTVSQAHNLIEAMEAGAK